jgi:uncharacterized protein (DUF58 family)
VLIVSELTVAEILKRVQRIEIVAKRAVDDLFAGQYKSVFRGRGMEFDEVREYQPGDDVRTIDWNVTARTGECFIKRYCEERELTVLFAIDVSASGAFGTTQRSKLDTIIEMVGMLMFSAMRNNDKVGLIRYCDQVIDFSPPRKGKSHVLNLLRQLVTTEPVSRKANVRSAVQFLNRVQKRRAVVFLISDFLDDYSKLDLAATNRRHDLTAVTVSDPRELTLPDVGFITLQDAETGEIQEVDTRHTAVRELFSQTAIKRNQQLSDRLKKSGIDQLAVTTDEDYSISLRKFFSRRERRAK